ncbi:MAG: O-antigen ligase family protein [Lachnospiraceae bacterium]|nr:O-antigen ligase family protein [Lachnospiraceae bacterium]
MTQEKLAENNIPERSVAEGPVTDQAAAQKGPDALRILFVLCGLLLSGYLILILAGHPFYMSTGFLKLGTDKAMFFRQATLWFGAVFLPFAAMAVLAAAVCLHSHRKQERHPAGALHLLRRLSVTEGFAIGYAAVLGISWLLSVNRETALWGETGWYLGFLPKLFCILIFLAFSRFRTVPERFYLLVFPVSAVIFGMEILERFGLSFWEFAGANPSKLATIGNINWYCGYLTAVFFAGAALLYSRRPGREGGAGGRTVTVLLMAYVLLGTVSLMTQGSASGYLSFLVCLCVFLYASRKDAGRTLRSFELLFFFGIACALIYAAHLAGHFDYEYTDPVSPLLVKTPLAPVLFAVCALCFALAAYEKKKAKIGWRPLILGVLAGVVPRIAVFLAVLFVLLLALNTWQQGWPLGGGAKGDSLLYFNDDWGSNRGIIWTVALSLFGRQDFLHKLFGVGPDCFYQAMCAPGAEEILARVNAHFGGARLTNAHNIFLNILVNEGVAGLACFCGMLFSAIRRFLRAGLGDPDAGEPDAGDPKAGADRYARRALACGMSVLAILANELFSFEQTMTIVLLAIWLGIGESAVAGRERKK